MDRKKELKEQYKQMKPQMGVFIIRSRSCQRCCIETARDLKGVMNGTVAKLKGGGHLLNRRLQEAWNENGAEDFVIEILETMEYHSEDPQYDYSEDLALLKMIWQDRFREEGWEFY
ncbi:MAG: GIY-YIG nuclease family protein [Syntrophomonadaceae bacterium]|nr:GIY-YIG nuclease family protein [Syntrophomonadaceae bacterium]